MPDPGLVQNSVDAGAKKYIFKSYISLLGIIMKTAKLFQNGQSQAVRLPKDFRFEGEEVFIKKTGNAVVLIPTSHSWDSLLGSLDKFTPDFMSERNQPQQQTREDVFA